MKVVNWANLKVDWRRAILFPVPHFHALFRSKADEHSVLRVGSIFLVDPWEGDRLGYQEIGSTFTNLVKSIDTEKVISIEAGFGRGKTFFRKAWAEHLRSEGEVVIEIDVQQSDHSGDPIVTLLGALVEALPKDKKNKGKIALASAKKLGALGARTVARVILKSGADELIETMTDRAADALDDFDALDGVVKDLGNEMSRVAGQIIASQMAVEKVRKFELPEQLNALRTALLKGSDSDKVVVIVDELDRCHPEYAISFLEAMKLMFYQSGFVFCLMVNANYLENLARHRFGVPAEDERYLDKFVDIRLRLAAKDGLFKTAVHDLACELPLAIPYGDGDEFSLKHAAKLAATLAEHTKFSMRKVKRVLLKVEIALRCYADRPLDASLLVFLAFRDEAGASIGESFLRRSFLTPEEGMSVLSDGGPFRGRNEDAEYRLIERIREQAPELARLPPDRYRLPDDQNYKEWALVFKFLAPHYIPSHRAVLDAVASVIVPTD